MKMINASYSKISRRVYFTTLRKVGVFGKYRNYNLYETHNNKYVVVFSDQGRLLRYIEDNQGKPIYIRFLTTTDNKYSYNVMTTFGEVKAKTLASAIIAFPDTTEDWSVVVESNGDIVIK